MKDIDYSRAHLIAKTFICCIVISLDIAGIEMGNPYLPLVFDTIPWFFGINTCGYIIEKATGKSPGHNIF